MNLTTLIVKYFFVILLGVCVFLIDGIENISYSYTLLSIVFFALFKCVYFFVFSVRKITELSVKNITYYRFLIFMSAYIALIVL
jgi:hypothetical protein